MSSVFTPLRRFAQSLGLVTVGVLSTLGALSLTHIGPVQAKSPGVSLASLVKRLNADEATIAALKAKTAPLSVSGTDLTIKGVNVHIVDGSGSTDDFVFVGTKHKRLTGLGNLIIGYNGFRGGKRDVRTGSRNLVLGDENNYSSYGGMVAGQTNSISGHYASVTGGLVNTASNSYAMVNGGQNNVASGYIASISGGFQNTASNNFATVNGGSSNTTSGNGASVWGGNTLMQNSKYGWTGGSYHTP